MEGRKRLNRVRNLSFGGRKLKGKVGEKGRRTKSKDVVPLPPPPPPIRGSWQLIIGHAFVWRPAAGGVVLDRARALIGSAIKSCAAYPGGEPTIQRASLLRGGVT